MDQWDIKMIQPNVLTSKQRYEYFQIAKGYSGKLDPFPYLTLEMIKRFDEAIQAAEEYAKEFEDDWEYAEKILNKPMEF